MTNYNQYIANTGVYKSSKVYDATGKNQSQIVTARYSLLQSDLLNSEVDAEDRSVSKVSTNDNLIDLNKGSLIGTENNFTFSGHDLVVQ